MSNHDAEAVRRMERALYRVFVEGDTNTGRLFADADRVVVAERILAALDGEIVPVGTLTALRDADGVIESTRKHLAKDHPNCAWTVLGIFNDEDRRALLASGEPVEGGRE